MRRYLTILFLIAILAIAVAPSQAQSINWSAGVDVTTMTPQSGIFSHMDWVEPDKSGIGDPFYWKDPEKTNVRGSWFSTAGLLPNLVKDGKSKYIAMADLPGFEKIQKVRLSPDGGVTQWEAELIPGKGWCVDMPIGTTKRIIATTEKQKGKGNQSITITTTTSQKVMGLEVGGFALQWGVESKDQKNKIRIIIISFSYSSTRRTSAATHVMVQSAQVDYDSLNDMAKSIYLREHGFQPATDGLSPAVMAAQQMGQQQPPPATTTPSPPASSCRSDNEAVQLDGVVRSEPERVKPKPVMVKVSLVFWKGETKQIWKDQLIPKDCFIPGQIVEFRRNSQLVGAAEVGSIRSDLGIVEFHIFRGGFPATGDKIAIANEEATQ